jgi:hypothetical protein
MAVIHDSQGRGIGAENPLPIRNTAYSNTIQTHNATSITNGATSFGNWFSTNGFERVAVNGKCDASVTWTLNIDWSFDGITQSGSSTISSTASFTKAGFNEILAPYARITVINGDTVSHTFSAWAYLKA